MKTYTISLFLVLIAGLIFFLLDRNMRLRNDALYLLNENKRLKQMIIEKNSEIEEINNVLDNKDSMCVWYYKPKL